MYLLAATILILSAELTGSMPGGLKIPQNITITFINPTSIKVSWSTSIENVDKYDVTYKPTDARFLFGTEAFPALTSITPTTCFPNRSYRVVAVVAGNSDAVTLSGLKADTQYQLTVAAVWSGKKYRSRPIVFRTLEPPKSSPQQEPMATFATDFPSTRDSLDSPSYTYPQTSSTVRGVEIGIVLLVLLVWVAAIALFFNRWGKIRMLLPYQPDYKQEQLKVPGTAACAAAMASGNTCPHNSRDHICQQVSSPLPQKHRSRLNSAIFVSNSGPGIDPKEFIRRHGSVSTLCKKASSFDNITFEENHFGLPTLSVSGPSPPQDKEQKKSTEELRNFM